MPIREINNIIPEYVSASIHQASEQGDIETVRSLLSNSYIIDNQKNYLWYCSPSFSSITRDLLRI